MCRFNYLRNLSKRLQKKSVSTKTFKFLSGKRKVIANDAFRVLLGNAFILKQFGNVCLERGYVNKS